MNKKALIIIGIGLLIVTIGGVFWYTSNESRKSTGQILNNNGQELARKNNEELIKVFKDDENISDSERIDTSNWKTYRNDYYGYQISYPEDWKIVEKIYRGSGNIIEGGDVHIVEKKECDLEQLRLLNKLCSNHVWIAMHGLSGAPCATDKTRDGKLSTTVLAAFNNIFTLKEEESRESLQYNSKNTGLHSFISDGVARGNYSFINDEIYLNKESCYLLRTRDSTKDRKYLKIEEAILESLKVIKKIK
jgi:hypothetical protein